MVSKLYGIAIIYIYALLDYTPGKDFQAFSN